MEETGSRKDACHRMTVERSRYRSCHLRIEDILWPVLWYQGDCQIINLRQPPATEFTCLKISHRAYGCERRSTYVPCQYSVFNTSDLYILPSKKSARSPSDLRRKSYFLPGKCELGRNLSM